MQPKSHLPPLKVSSELTEAKLQLTCECACVCVSVYISVCVCLLCNCVALFFVANLPKVRTHRQSQRTLTPPTRLTALSALKAIRQLEASAQGVLCAHPVAVIVVVIVGFCSAVLLLLALSII